MLPRRRGKYSKVMLITIEAKGQKSRLTKTSKKFGMDNAKSMKEYIARAKSLALIVKYHGIKVPEQEKTSRVLIGRPPAYASKK